MTWGTSWTLSCIFSVLHFLTASTGSVCKVCWLFSFLLLTNFQQGLSNRWHHSTFLRRRLLWFAYLLMSSCFVIAGNKKHISHNSLPPGCCWRHISNFPTTEDNREERRMQPTNSKNNPLAIMGPLMLHWQMAVRRMQIFIFNTQRRRGLRLKEVYWNFTDSEWQFLHFTCLSFQRLKSSSRERPSAMFSIATGPKRGPPLWSIFVTMTNTDLNNNWDAACYAGYSG